MADTLGTHFAEVLKRCERTRDVSEMAQSFSARATLRRAPQMRTYQGRDGVHEFWTAYLNLFARIETEFTNIIESEDCAVLEWRSRGRLHTGHDVVYEGVSIVEADADGRVGHFRTYYDAGAVTHVHGASHGRKQPEVRPQF